MISLRYRPDSETLHDLIFPWMTRCGLVSDEQSKQEEGEPNCSKCSGAPLLDRILYYEVGFGVTVRCITREFVDEDRGRTNKLSDYEDFYRPYAYQIEIFYYYRLHREVRILAFFDNDDSMEEFVGRTVTALHKEIVDRQNKYEGKREEYRRALIEKRETKKGGRKKETA